MVLTWYRLAPSTQIRNVWWKDYLEDKQEPVDGLAALGYPALPSATQHFPALPSARVSGGCVQKQQSEALLRIRPLTSQCPAGVIGKLRKTFNRVFVRRLRMKTFIGVQRVGLARDRYRLIGGCHQVHFNSRRVGVITRFMRERIHINRQPELTIQALKQVAVKRRRNALWIVVGGDEYLWRFIKINTNQERSALA